MTQIKKIPFDYEYFKQHPETKLETRDGRQARFIGERVMVEHKYKLLFEHNEYNFSTTIEGYYSDGDFNNIDDILMLIGTKELVVYVIIYEKFISGSFLSLDEAIECHLEGALSVAKQTIIDGGIIKTETVHKY